MIFNDVRLLVLPDITFVPFITAMKSGLFEKEIVNFKAILRKHFNIFVMDFFISEKHFCN